MEQGYLLFNYGDLKIKSILSILCHIKLLHAANQNKLFGAASVHRCRHITGRRFTTQNYS